MSHELIRRRRKEDLHQMNTSHLRKSIEYGCAWLNHFNRVWEWRWVTSLYIWSQWFRRFIKVAIKGKGDSRKHVVSAVVPFGDDSRKHVVSAVIPLSDGWRWDTTCYGYGVGASNGSGQWQPAKKIGEARCECFSSTSEGVKMKNTIQGYYLLLYIYMYIYI